MSDLQAFLAKMDAQKALAEKAKEASKGFGGSSGAIFAMNKTLGTSLCPYCNEHVMLSTKCKKDTLGRYHMDLIDS